MAILGISAHYHDAAAALVVDGAPGVRRAGGAPLAAQERRRVSARRHRVVPGARGLRARGARRGGLLREADAQVRAHPDDGAARASRARGRSFPRAMQDALGGKLWVKGIIASAPRRARRRRSCSPSTTRRTRPPPSSRRPRGAPRSSPPTASASGRRSRSGAASAGRRQRVARAPARDPLPALARACSTRPSPRTSGFAVNEGEYKVMGLAAYGKPRFEPQVRADRCSARRRRASRSTWRTSTTTRRAARSLLRSRSWTSSGRRAHPLRADRPRDAGGRALRRHRARSVQRVLEDVLVDLARALQRETGLERPLSRRRRRAERLRQRAHPARVGLRARLRAARAGRRRLRARRRALRRPRPLRPAATASVPDHPYWGPELDAGELARLAREDGLDARAARRRAAT